MAPTPPKARGRSRSERSWLAEEEEEEDEYVDLPQESRFPRWIVALLIVVLIIGAGVGGVWWWYQRQVDPPGAAGARVEVVVPPGSTSSRIGSILAGKGVVSNATLFNFYIGRENAGPFQAGTYTFQRSSSFDEALAQLRRGPKAPIVAKTVKVTIPEGYTVAQLVARIHEEVPRLTVADLQAALAGQQVKSRFKPADVTSYEGLLFPATYDVGEKTTALDLLNEMAAEMEKRVDGLGLDSSLARIKQVWGIDLTPYDALKVASMIQYEAAGEADAAKIGTVTYNRLKDNIPLGYDSTSIYEAGLEGKAPGTVDYKVDTAYNTRTKTGLPPTPISASGLYALEGALQPAEGPWLYFVLTDSKEVTFAVTYQEFLDAKRLCQQRNLGCG